MIERFLNLSNLLKKGKSAFLFGPRGVGKTVLAQRFLKERGSPSSVLDLLNLDTYRRYLAEPGLFRKELEREIKTKPTLSVLVDEIQKLPALLDEVHFLLEKFKGKLQFLLLKKTHDHLAIKKLIDQIELESAFSA